ncbi:MBL fold metallo-hydrolase [Cohnella zeiphila]|uniref:MBL fold metallo-hydrolase n=1 Tax=Cohnella zeiphila TaxID=2761120 RepID=A0A7X0SP53_9BACL|nr:MBL fold metallo-hydrolase [Cohnella zeiphila]MBB6733531.1 MBL fold metallo-hydrolase [Cohnella zeiphila]
MNSLSTITKLAGGWLQLKVPVPFSLRWVNSYLLPEKSGWTVIDPGLRSAETEAFWEAALLEAGIAWTSIERIVLTHHHPDHYGLAGWFQEKTGAPVYLSETGRRSALWMWGENETSSGELLAAFAAHGMPAEREEGMKGHLRNVIGQVLPHPRDVRPLPEPGETFEMAGTVWTLIGGEGHAPGHRSFYQPDLRRLICGDQVLPDITPNIGWMPGTDPDPLGSYLASLRAMLPLEADLAFPGHRDPFGELRTRIGEILAHHDERLDRMVSLLAEWGPMTAYETAGRLFRAKVMDDSHQLRFAMAETIAHLERLVLEDRAVRREETGADGKPVIRYGPAVPV